MADQKSNYELELYNAHACPFGHRGWFTILQKKIDVNLKDSFIIHWIDLRNKPKEFSEKYALALGADPKSDGKVPTIQHNGKYMAESAVVAAYLDRHYNDEKKYGPSLIPSDPWDAAKVELMNDMIGNCIMKPFFGLLMNKGDTTMKEAKINGLKNGLLALNAALLKSSNKGFLLENNNVSLFEISIYPFFYRLETAEILTGVPILSKWFNLKCDESKGLERVINWFDSCNGLESVKKMKEIVTTPMLVELYRPWTVELTFYNNHVCPFGQRAWFALTVKNIKYQWVNCSLNMSPTPKEDYFIDAYAKAIGHEEGSDGKVPVIKHNNNFLTESSQIVRYVDKCFDDASKYGDSLFPGKDDPVGFHACECLCDWVGSHLMQAFYKILLNDDRSNHTKMIDKLFNDLKVLCDRLNQVSESGLLLKDNRISAFEVLAFPFVWRFMLHPLIAKESKKDVPIDKWLEKDSKEFPELKRVQDWYYTIFNHEATQKMLNDKDHKITIQELAAVYGKGYSKTLKN